VKKKDLITSVIVALGLLALGLTGGALTARADGCTDWVCSSNSDCDPGCHCCIATETDGGGNCCQ
jgi:hypothetical protein